ncbi:MAG TPA: hypothetical protein VKA63_04915, partial [Candidatus Krumholzibacteria bacterium]|nr:hypothetical protein [Candidatus Krumholzibacteria bacterium]
MQALGINENNRMRRITTRLRRIKRTQKADGNTQHSVSAEKRLISNQQRLQGLIDRLPAIVWTTDCTLRFNSVQGSGLTLLQQDPERIVNRTMQEVFSTNDPDFKPLAHQLKAVEGISSSYEWHWRGRDFAVSVKPLIASDQTIFGSVGIALDVTADRHNTRQLASARQ